MTSEGKKSVIGRKREKGVENNYAGKIEKKLHTWKIGLLGRSVRSLEEITISESINMREPLRKIRVDKKVRNHRGADSVRLWKKKKVQGGALARVEKGGHRAWPDGWNWGSSAAGKRRKKKK